MLRRDGLNGHLKVGSGWQTREEGDTLELVLKIVESMGKLRTFAFRVESNRAADLYNEESELKNMRTLYLAY